MKNDRGMTESARVKKINELLCERWRNRITGRCFMLLEEVDGVCLLESIDRRTLSVCRWVLTANNSAWERLH